MSTLTRRIRSPCCARRERRFHKHFLNLGAKAAFGH
jgi:hypothetical protein